MNVLRTMQRLLRDTRAATAVEYAMLCALLFLAILASVKSVASETSSMWTRINTTIQNATAA